MKRSLESIRMPALRPRNPLVAPTRARKAGRHTSVHPKTASRQRLARQLERLDPQGP